MSSTESVVGKLRPSVAGVGPAEKFWWGIVRYLLVELPRYCPTGILRAACSEFVTVGS